MIAFMRDLFAIAILITSTGCRDNVVTTDAPDGPVALQAVGAPLGDEPVIMIQHDGASLPAGTFIAHAPRAAMVAAVIALSVHM
jgi:hypothetical protein